MSIFLSPAVWKNCLVLSKSNYWTYQKNYWSVGLVKNPFCNVSGDEKVYFTKTLLNIIQNFIQHEIIICDDRDPPWIKKEIKKLVVEKNLAFKTYSCSNRNMFLLEKSKALQYQLQMPIKESKKKYYTKLSSMLADPLTRSKTYWSILKHS